MTDSISTDSMNPQEHTDPLDALRAARTLLDSVTPLRSDCGRLCGAACCTADAPESGMYLFPHEEALYDASDTWMRLVPTDWAPDGQPASLLICEGHCPRDRRPLACRIFPLALRCTEAAPQVKPDVRAWPVCPLMPHAPQGLSVEFISAVRAALALLWAVPEHRCYLQALDALLHSFEAL